jgi:hypothetical protein
MITFKNYLAEKKAVFVTFGRMNPPTKGHGFLLDTIKEKAGKNPYRIFLSHSQDNKRNPLLYEDKIKFARKMFPSHSRNIHKSDSKNILEVATQLFKEGFLTLNVVVGSDRQEEFQERLDHYNGKLYQFTNINVISAGERDADAEGIKGVSASQAREFVTENDYHSFNFMLPVHINDIESKKLFNDLREGMGFDKVESFKTEIKKSTDLREKYLKGELFKVGMKVVEEETDQFLTITRLCTNYVICEDDLGNKYRKWLTTISQVEE